MINISPLNSENYKKWEYCTFLGYLLPILTLLFCFFPLMLLAQDDDGHLILQPKDRTIVQRCFLQLDNEKNTFCVAVGEPNKIHYALDLSTGAIVKIWKGDFLDVTTMWTGRGQEQLAKPLGNKLLTIKSVSPFLFFDKKAQKGNDDENIKFKGYDLDMDGSPVFKYLVNDIEVSDRVWSVEEDTQQLNRKIGILSHSRPVGAMFRLAHGSSIQRLKKNIYSINGRSYVITINSKLRSEPIILKTDEGVDLVIPLTSLKINDEIDYSIVW